MIDDAHEDTHDATPPDRQLLGPWTPWILLVVLGAVCVAAFVLWRETGRDRKSADLDSAFEFDIERYKIIPPDQLGYEEAGRIETGLAGATAIATGPRDEIVAGGEGQILVFDAGGERRHALPVPTAPWALAVSDDGVLFVGYRNIIEQGPLAGPLQYHFEIPGDKVRITSIAVSPEAVFVADYGTRVVWHFARDGSAKGRIGDPDPERGVPGFVVPSPYFDVLLAKDGLLRIVDPGRRQIDAFTIDGDLEVAWGRASYALDGFIGCCNPSHIAELPNGFFVTSEKGVARVKVYDETGRFVTAVVAPGGLDTEAGPCDVATDSRGRILVLDPGRGVIRVFVRKPKTGDSR